ncbi:MAG: LPD38 domain-containing protein, partial [Gemmatimonadota bacterium]
EPPATGAVEIGEEEAEAGLEAVERFRTGEVAEEPPAAVAGADALEAPEGAGARRGLAGPEAPADRMRRERIRELDDEADRIRARADAEGRDLTADERAEVERLQRRRGGLHEEGVRRQRRVEAPTAEEPEGPAPAGVERAAIAELGETTSPAEAGYITAEGRMIDLSGGSPGGRTEDHRAIAMAYPDDYTPPHHREGSNVGYMLDFMERGNVRFGVSGNTVSVDFVRPPTPQQVAAIRRAVGSMRGTGDLAVDLTAPDGSVIASRHVRGARAADVSATIDDLAQEADVGAGRAAPVEVDKLTAPADPLRLASEALPGARRLAGGRAREAGESLDIPTREGIVRELSEALGVPVRTGRFRQRALGIFKRKPEVIRTQTANDIETVAHEAGHHIHKMLFGTTPGGRLAQGPLRPWAEELRPLGYDDSVKEGYAEFMRLYVTNAEEAKRRAPTFFEFADAKIRADWPEAHRALQRARADYEVYANAPAQARVRAQRARPEDLKPRLAGMETWRKLRTAAIDDLAPLRAVAREGAQRADAADLAADAGTLADLARGSAGQAELMIEHGMIDFETRQVVGPSLRAAFDPIRTEGGELPGDALESFWDYATSRRVLYLQRTREGEIGYLGIDPEDAATTVSELDSPAFRKVFDNLQQWNDGLLRWLRDAGVVTDDGYAQIRAANEEYVPLMRAMEEDAGLRGSGSQVNRRDPVHRIKGSGRLILDPGEVMLERAYEYTRLAAKQQVANAVVRLSRIEGMGALVEEIDAPMKAFRASIDEVMRQIPPGVLDEDIADDALPEFLMFFRPGDYLNEANTISVLSEGRRVWYKLDPELYKAIEGIDREHIPLLLRIAGAPSRTLRAGATLAPEFSLRNPVRDQVMAFIQSEYGYTPFVDLARGLGSMLRKDEYWQAFKAGGGARSSLVGLDRKSIRRAFQKAVREGGVPNVVKNPLDALRALSEAMEDATRVGETRKALQRLRAEGVPEGEAVQRAAKAAREVSLDFARHGSKTGPIRWMTAFWNAQVQGYDKLARTFKADPQGATTKALAMITLPSVFEYMVNRDDPEYFELPRWQRDLFWVFKVGGHWVRIPKPFELGIVFGTIPQRTLEWMDRRDPQGFQRAWTETLAQNVGDLALPVPTFARPLIDNYANRHSFFQRPIVPRALEGVDPEFQATERTSEVAKQFGRLFGVSPAKVDNLLFSYTGGLGRSATEAIDLAAETAGVRERGRVETRPLPLRLPGLRGFAVSPPGRASESVDRMYTALEEADRRYRTLRHLQSEGRTEDARAYMEEHRPVLQARGKLRSAADALANIREQVDRVESDGELPAAERRARVLALERRMTEIAATVMGRPVPGRDGTLAEPVRP